MVLHQLFGFTLRRLTVVPLSRGASQFDSLFFLPFKNGQSRQPLDLGLRHTLPLSWQKKTCLRRSIWHGLCSMASIRPFTRQTLTLGVACRQCLHPCGMTAYTLAFNLAVNLAKRVLFVLFYEQQTPVFVLHPIWPNTSSSSCCFSGTNSSKLFAPYFLFGVAFCTSSIIHVDVACPWSCALVGCDRHSACCEIKKDY